MYFHHTPKVDTYIQFRTSNDKIEGFIYRCEYNGRNITHNEFNTNKWLDNYMEDATEFIKGVYNEVNLMIFED